MARFRGSLSMNRLAGTSGTQVFHGLTCRVKLNPCGGGQPHKSSERVTDVENWKRMLRDAWRHGVVVCSVTLRRLEGTRITSWQSLTSDVYTSMQSLFPKTFVELPDYDDLDTRTRCCGRQTFLCTARDRLQGRGNVNK